MTLSVTSVTWCTKRNYIDVCPCNKCHLLLKTELYRCLSLYQVWPAAQNAAILMFVCVPSVTWCLKRSYIDVRLRPHVTCCLKRSYIDVCLCTKCHLLPETVLYWCLSLYQVSPGAYNAAILMSVCVPSVTCCLKRSYIDVCLCTNCHLLSVSPYYSLCNRKQ